LRIEDELKANAVYAGAHFRSPSTLIWGVGWINEEMNKIKKKKTIKAIYLLLSFYFFFFIYYKISNIFFNSLYSFYVK
jgi:hypothetical protein